MARTPPNAAHLVRKLCAFGAIKFCAVAWLLPRRLSCLVYMQIPAGTSSVFSRKSFDTRRRHSSLCVRICGATTSRGFARRRLRDSETILQTLAKDRFSKRLWRLACLGEENSVCLRERLKPRGKSGFRYRVLRFHEKLLESLESGLCQIFGKR